MRSFDKRIGIIVLAAVMVFTMAGCASMTLVSMDESSVSGPPRVRQGQDINPRDITIYGIYKDGSRKVVSVNSSNITFNKHTPGPQTVRVRVSRQEVSFQTEVMALRSLTIASPPRTVLFKEGVEADPSWPGLEVRGTWDQMGSDRIDLSYCEISGYMKDQPGRQTIRVAYEGLTATFEVDVRSMSSIQIIQAPTKIEYLQGEQLDTTGLRVVGVWGDGIPNEELTITARDITGYNPTLAGVQRVVITKNGRTATFDVEVLALTSITITAAPTKIRYVFGEELDLAGIEVAGNYTGGRTTVSRIVPIPFEKISYTNYNPNLIQRQMVTIRVEGTAANVTATFIVEVTLPPN